jgi:hypothetical protein
VRSSPTAVNTPAITFFPASALAAINDVPKSTPHVAARTIRAGVVHCETAPIRKRPMVSELQKSVTMRPDASIDHPRPSCNTLATQSPVPHSMPQ